MISLTDSLFCKGQTSRFLSGHDHLRRMSVGTSGDAWPGVVSGL